MSSKWLFAVDQRSHIRRPETIVYIHHAYVTGAGVQHAEQGGQAFEGSSVADAGGDGDYRDSDQASDYAGESAFHPRADDDDSGLGEKAAVGEEAVDAGDSDVIEMLDAIAHEFGGDHGFFGYRNIARASRDDGDYSFTITTAIAVEGDRSGFGAVGGFGDLGHNCVELFFGCARGQNVAIFVVKGQAGENLGYLGRRFALAENHLGHPLPQGPMVVYFGEVQVFEGEMAQASYGFVGGEFAGPHFLEEAG